MMDTPLPDDNGVLLETYGNEQFSRDVLDAFVDLREELEENANLLHVQMGTLSGAVRSALRSADTEFPLRVCAFLHRALRQPRAIPEIENAIAISFVEAYEFRATPAGQIVLSRMPDRIRQILLEQENRGGAQ